MRSVPFSCPRCRESGWPTGGLVFDGAEVPECKYHPGVLFERSPFYDENGLRLHKHGANTPFMTMEGEVTE